MQYVIIIAVAVILLGIGCFLSYRLGYEKKRKTDEEKILEKQKLPEEDVVLDATLAIMGKVIELNQEEGNAFSFTK